MRLRNALLCLAFTLCATSLSASEVSVLSGFYRSQQDTPGFKQQTLAFGGRYGFKPAEDRRFWFLDAELRSTSYSGDGAPDGSTGLQIGGGQKYFFQNFSNAIHTFLAWSAGYRSSEAADAGSKTEASGVYYAGNGGFRFDFTKTLFVDIEAQFFNSSLMSTSKTTTTATGATSESKVTEVQADTFSGVDSLRFGVGMIF